MEVRWGKMHKHEKYRTLHRGGKVVGWVVLLEGVWVARLANGTIRAEFDTVDEAQQFLLVMANIGESDE